MFPDDLKQAFKDGMERGERARPRYKWKIRFLLLAIVFLLIFAISSCARFIVLITAL